MKKYLFLSSAFLMTMAGANAADKIITSANTCTVDVLGVSDNNATANTIATWDLIDYTLNPGQYLSVTETSVDKTTCPAGSYCVGGGYTVETANNSIAQCPTGYPNSATGAGADTQCYTACTVATANIAHATAVSGNDYYGTGTDTCGATACDKGYHVDGDIEIIEKKPLVDINYKGTGGSHFAAIDANGAIYAPSDLYDELSNRPNNSWVSVVDQTLIYGIASCQPIMGNNELNTLKNGLMGVLGGVMSIEEFKTAFEPIAGVAKTNLATDLILAIQQRGVAGLTDDEFNELFGVFLALRDVQFNTTDIGPYCFCKATAAKNIDGVMQNIVSAPWGFPQQSLFEGWDASQCATDCAVICANVLSANSWGNDAFRAAVFGALDYTQTGICAANTINIDWNPDNGGEHIKNMCTYEGSITLPTPDPVKPGYTFTGWKLLENTTTE